MIDPTDDTFADWLAGIFGLSLSYSELKEICVEMTSEIKAVLEEIADLLWVKMVAKEAIPRISPDQARDFYCAAFNKWVDDNKKKVRSPPREG